MQEGDLIFHLPGAENWPTVYSHVEHGPYFITRPVGESRHEEISPSGEKISSALEAMNQKFAGFWVKYDMGLPIHMENQDWIVQISKIVFECSEDSFLHCTLIGECVADTTHLPPHHPPTCITSSCIEENKIRVMAIH